MRFISSAVLLATAAVLAAGGAAHGSSPSTPGSHRSVVHTIVLHDGAGDVWTFSDTTAGYEPATKPAADIRTARVTHGPYAVSTRMVLDDLRRMGIQWFYVDIHTPEGTSWFILEARKGERQGTVYQDVEGEWVQTSGIGHRIDYVADVVTLRFPRTMLGAPPWVRVRLRTVLRLPDATFFTDNPTNTGPEAAFTPRVTPPLTG